MVSGASNDIQLHVTGQSVIDAFGRKWNGVRKFQWVKIQEYAKNKPKITQNDSYFI